MKDKLVIYGSTGYTGRLIAEEAVRIGLPILLAGRNENKLRAQSEALGGIPWKVASLEHPGQLDNLLNGHRAVMHCAGPFFRTWRVMAEACLRNGVHYMDITGEIDVIEGLHSLDERFRSAGLMALPGTGFDVVPTDILAAELRDKLPDATQLDLAFQTRGTRASHGTASSVASRLGNGGVVRRGGRFQMVPTAWLTRKVDFGHGPRTCVSIPWGDVSTAFHSTGILDITVYMAVPPRSVAMLKASNLINPLLRTRLVRGFIQRRIDQGPEGPTAEQRSTGRSLIWGRVCNAKGEAVEMRFETLEGYALTAKTSVAIASWVLGGGEGNTKGRDGNTKGGGATPGFQTPSKAFRGLLREMLGFDALKDIGTLTGSGAAGMG